MYAVIFFSLIGLKSQNGKKVIFLGNTANKWALAVYTNAGLNALMFASCLVMFLLCLLYCCGIKNVGRIHSCIIIKPRIGTVKKVHIQYTFILIV
jgi:hypothetical protein